MVDSFKAGGDLRIWGRIKKTYLKEENLKGTTQEEIRASIEKEMERAEGENVGKHGDLTRLIDADLPERLSEQNEIQKEFFDNSIIGVQKDGNFYLFDTTPTFKNEVRQPPRLITRTTSKFARSVGQSPRDIIQERLLEKRGIGFDVKFKKK